MWYAHPTRARGREQSTECEEDGENDHEGSVHGTKLVSSILPSRRRLL